MNHLKRLRSYTPFHPPPEDGLKEEKSIRRCQGTDYNYSTGYMIPTRFLGVNFYIKEVS
jgi:hypothetical protein